MKFLNKLGNLIAGSSSNNRVEERIFNIATFISIIVSFLSLAINHQLHLPILLNVIIAIGSFILLYIFIKSRIFKVFHIYLYIIIAVIILSGTWLFNEGPFGSINYIYILAFVIFLSITNRKQHLWISLILVVNLTVLYYIYFFHPDWITHYPSDEVREMDLLFTFIYVIVFSALIFSSLRMNYENEKNKVEVQKAKIELQHKHITDSILYAQDIQRALIQEVSELKNYFKESFIVWHPKDIVSGDFYYFRELKDHSQKTIVVVADCTGHGVPGALLTMLGVSFLNDILAQHPTISSNVILDLLRVKIKETLCQSQREFEGQDGMDMAICIVDKKAKTIDYAGANRSLIIIKNKEMNEVKPDRMPIGIYLHNNKDFTSHNISIDSNDVVYMFTDGFSDQFGEVESRKYYVSNFKKLLLCNSHKPLKEQGKLLNLEFLNWMGVHEQIDDVLVVGFKPLS